MTLVAMYKTDRKPMKVVRDEMAWTRMVAKKKEID